MESFQQPMYQPATEPILLGSSSYDGTSSSDCAGGPSSRRKDRQASRLLALLFRVKALFKRNADPLKASQNGQAGSGSSILRRGAQQGGSGPHGTPRVHCNYTVGYSEGSQSRDSAILDLNASLPKGSKGSKLLAPRSVGAMALGSGPGDVRSSVGSRNRTRVTPGVVEAAPPQSRARKLFSRASRPAGGFFGLRAPAAASAPGASRRSCEPADPRRGKASRDLVSDKGNLVYERSSTASVTAYPDAPIVGKLPATPVAQMRPGPASSSPSKRRGMGLGAAQRPIREASAPPQSLHSASSVTPGAAPAYHMPHAHSNPSLAGIIAACRTPSRVSPTPQASIRDRLRAGQTGQADSSSTAQAAAMAQLGSSPSRLNLVPPTLSRSSLLTGGNGSPARRTRRSLGPALGLSGNDSGAAAAAAAAGVGLGSQSVPHHMRTYGAAGDAVSALRGPRSFAFDPTFQKELEHVLSHLSPPRP